MREAGLDGIELAGANGMLFTQFLSPAINGRKDEYGGSLENRARFALEVVRAIRAEVGDDFCLGFKISVDEAPRELLPWLRRGNTRRGRRAGLPLARGGGRRLHPRERRHGLPASAQPGRPTSRRGTSSQTYDTLLSSGTHGRSATTSSSSTWPLSAVFRWWWERPSRRLGIEGINLAGVARGEAERVESRCSAPAASRRRR